MSSEPAVADDYDVEAVNSAKRRQPLYAPRRKIFPKAVHGNFRRFKWLMMLATLTIYYVTPWLRWDRGPFAPDQAVLVDLVNRRFYFFFIEIWPQEFYYVAGMLVMAGIGLFLVTSTVGRAWCGYACPQTVWVDLFMAVERMIEGERAARIRLDAAPWSPGKLLRRASKHGLWLLIGVATGGAWALYFADAPTLLGEVVTLEAPAVAYFTIAILTATTYTFGGLMREQVCTYMCPWPRIQAAMLDEHSLTVTYNDWRGEPRSRHAKKAAAAGKAVGDCVDCNACVAACPMGIDIRDGQQLECITCALCIDACDDVMDRLGKERGLISYATLNDYNHNMMLASGGGATINPRTVRDPASGRLVEGLKRTSWRSIVRPRTLVYVGLLGVVGIAMLAVLSQRSPLAVGLTHDRNPRYVLLQDGSVRNGYDVNILNMTPQPRTVTMTLGGLPGGAMSLADSRGASVSELELELEPDKALPLRLYVTADPGALAATPTKFDFVLASRDGLHVVAAANFETPEARR